LLITTTRIVFRGERTLTVGQQCLAIGNPFGFDNTITVGVISGLNLDIFSQAGVTFGGGIQTDAAIKPGNKFVDMVQLRFHISELTFEDTILLAPRHPKHFQVLCLC
jgi:S1-C subfamily serine protease